MKFTESRLRTDDIRIGTFIFSLRLGMCGVQKPKCICIDWNKIAHIFAQSVNLFP